MAVFTASAPSRICLAGEDLDWLGGASIQAAIDLRLSCEVALGKPTDGFMVLSDGTLNGVHRSQDAWSVPASSWASLASACARFRRNRSDALVPIKLKISSDIPASAGLASSAALTVAALAAENRDSDPLRYGANCWYVERALAGRDVGPMDYLPIIDGGVSIVRCNESGVEASNKFEGANFAVVLVDTGGRRDTSSVISRKRARSESGDPRIARYIALTRDIVEEMAVELGRTSSTVSEIGHLVSAAHRLLRDEMMVSTPLIEEAVQLLDAGGAVGSKLTGTGEGGCVFGLFPCGFDTRSVLGRLRAQGFWARSVELCVAGVRFNDM